MSSIKVLSNLNLDVIFDRIDDAWCAKIFR